MMSLWDSKSDGSPLEVAKLFGHSDVVEMMEEAIRCKGKKQLICVFVFSSFDLM